MCKSLNVAINKCVNLCFVHLLSSSAAAKITQQQQQQQQTSVSGVPRCTNKSHTNA